MSLTECPPSSHERAMMTAHEQPFARLHIEGNPFSMATGGRQFYHTTATRIILEELVHGILTRKGFLLLMGEVGVGKTSLALQLFARLESEPVDYAWVFTTMFSKEDLFRAICHDFGLRPEPSWSLWDHQQALQTFFLERYHAERICLIVVDEAHNLNFESLEALRLLGNFEFGGTKLVQVLLIAQPELGERLQEPSLRQLKSRIAIAHTLPELSQKELTDYTHFKLSGAGSNLRLTPGGGRILWQATRGNLRLANLVLERALYACMALESDRLSSRVMRTAVADLQSTCAPRPRPWWTVATAALIIAAVALAFVPLWMVDGARISAAELIYELLSESKPSPTP